MSDREWVGDEYQATRLLLLGESQYSWLENGEVVHPSLDHATEMVEDVLRRFPTYSFMTKLSMALACEERPSLERLKQVWNRVAFVNYVPGTVGVGARVRPTPEMWAAAKNSFPDILKRLRPRRIVVLGITMWSMMPDSDLHITDNVQAYRLPDGSLSICWALNHPSRGLSWRELAGVIYFGSANELNANHI